MGGDSGESKPLWKGEGERPNRREKKGTKGLMGKESHAIIILGIQYNNCIVDRKIFGKKTKERRYPGKGKVTQLRVGKQSKGKGEKGKEIGANIGREGERRTKTKGNPYKSYLHMGGGEKEGRKKGPVPQNMIDKASKQRLHS